ncbi:Retrovirus-related Pol polyprotein from transposon 297 [Vitis vinifera]|uniref:RNA-directed DNA polymerase n=1 Tax=Vitis vinifera TaxID=29760 RepID=A0A438FWY6_VITVI|nr:Retrovirus-related Pol polyprotein from transposon 297 [Vitis vinifera]
MEEKESEISEKKKDYDSTMNAIPEKELLEEEMLKKSTSPLFLKHYMGKKGIRNAAEILESYHFSHDWRKGSGESLLDLGASVNLLPYSVYKQLGLGELKPTTITLSLADRSVKIPRGVIEDVLVQVDNFYYPVDFIVLDTDPTIKEANLVPIILGRPFLATSNAIINCRNGLMQLTFGLSEPPNVLATLQSWRKIEEILPLFNKEEEAVAEKEMPKLNLKPLPVELKYIYLEENNQCPVVISSSLTSHQENCLMEVLKRYYLPISDSPWVSPTQVVPKKSRITVVQNEKGEEITTRLTSGYFQIEIDVEDQEKTTFTCPFGTYAYRRMSFGLCNAPATFQRCMLSIFSDMVERIMEVFMDDITVYGGIEVDKAKVELIVKLPSPTTVKGVRQFLGHAGFYRRSCAWPKRRWEALLGSFIIVFTDHSALKYLLTKQDAKARLIRWILLLQEFDLQIKDKKGVENVVIDHLSSEWNAQDRKHFFAKIHAYYWEEPFLFKYCADQIIRKCVPEEEQKGILNHCHENACGGHFASQKIAMKCCNQDLLGHLFSKMPTSCVEVVIDAKGLES